MTPVHETEVKLPTAESMRELADATRGCVTIFLAGHKGGAGTQPASQRLHGLLPALEKQAAGAGMTEAEVLSLFAPLHDLVSDPALTAGSRDSFAIFRAENVLELMRVPGLPLEGAWVEDRFRLLPVLERIAARPELYLLTLTRRRARLLHVTLDGFEELAFPAGVIASLDEFNAFDPPDHTLRNMSSSGGGGSVAFGTGSEKEKQNRHFRDFCHGLDRGLHAMFTKSNVPLLLAGTAPEVAIYREVCEYQKLVEPAVTLSPDGGWTDAALVQRAREIAAAWISPDLERVLNQFERKSGTAHAVREAIAVSSAAAGGRAASLIVTEGVRMQREGGGDLVNTAAADTLRFGGTVWIAPRGHDDKVPPFAAVLRY